MKNVDATRVRRLKQLEEALVALRELAFDLHEPMLVHLFEIALRQIEESVSSAN